MRSVKPTRKESAGSTKSSIANVRLAAPGMVPTAVTSTHCRNGSLKLLWNTEIFSIAFFLRCCCCCCCCCCCLFCVVGFVPAAADGPSRDPPPYDRGQ